MLGAQPEGQKASSMIRKLSVSENQPTSHEFREISKLIVPYAGRMGQVAKVHDVAAPRHLQSTSCTHGYHVLDPEGVT
jgi:hypothetical protein